MKHKTIIVLLPVFILGILLTSAYASSKAIKKRMIERLPTIRALKEKGLIGENNKGYLEFVGSKKEKTDVIEAENTDRKKVYGAIAKQQGTTVELVGKHRAIQIAKKAKTGEWLQDANGKWYQQK
jgi:uncharacterized protein YdbL (DUF1318 family)